MIADGGPSNKINSELRQRAEIAPAGIEEDYATSNKEGMVLYNNGSARFIRRRLGLLR